MAQSEAGARRAEQPGHIAAAVVAHHAPDGDTARRKPRDCAREEGGAGGTALVGQHFDIGDATVIVDRHVDIFPPDPWGAAPPIAVHAMADTANAAERLDVHVNE